MKRYLAVIKTGSFDEVNIAITAKNLSVFLLAPRVGVIGFEANDQDIPAIRAVPGILDVQEEGRMYASKE